MKKIPNRLIFCLILIVVFVAVPVFGESYDHTIKAKEIGFSWKIDKDMIHIKLEGQTNGWVGIGFNPEKRMQGANFILGMVKNGKVKVADHFGNGERNHEKDKSLSGKSNVKNKKGSEKDGFTEIMFSIPLNSGDKMDKPIDPNGNTIIYLALGGGRDSFNSRHKARYIYEVKLSTGIYKEITKGH